MKIIKKLHKDFTKKVKMFDMYPEGGAGAGGGGGGGRGGPPNCLTWKCQNPNQLLRLWIALLVTAPKEYHQDWIVTYRTFVSSKDVVLFYLKHKALCHSHNSDVIKYFVCLSSDWIQWNK
jgi:hypothetical protein